MNKLVCLWTLFFVTFFSIYTQGMVEIRNFTIEEGLSENDICQIDCDSKGYIWILTHSGISRFDGYGFKNIDFPIDDHVSQDLFALDSCYIYIPLEGQIARWNLQKECWDEEIVLPSSGSVSAIASWNHCIYWSQEDKIVCLDKKSKTISYRIVEEPVCNIICADSALYVATKHTLYKTSKGVSLELIKKSLSDGDCIASATDGSEVAFLYGNKLYRYRSDEWREDALSENYKHIFYYKNKIWGIEGNNTVKSIENGESPWTRLLERRLSNAQIDAVYSSRGNSIWIGTQYNGFYQCVDQNPIVKHYHTKNTKGLEEADVVSFLERDSLTLWMLTRHQLYIWNKQTHSVEKVWDQKKVSSQSLIEFKRVYQESRNTLLITSNKGVYRWSGKGVLIENTRNTDILDMCRRKNGMWLMVTSDNELIQADSIFNIRSRLVPGKMRSDHVPLNHLTSVYELNNGEVLLGTESGVVLFDESTYSFQVVENKGEYLSGTITTFYEDSEHRVWLGTQRGKWVEYIPESHSYRFFKSEDGFQATSVFSIIQDYEGSLWLGTERGVCRYMPKKNVFTWFSANDGIQSKAFNTNSVIQDSMGSIYLGGKGGVNRIEPRQLKSTVCKASLCFSDIKVNGGSVSLDQIEGAELDYNQNDLSFDMALLNYNHPSQNRYAIQLLPNDKDWVNVDHQHNILYHNLTWGEYTLRVKGWSKEGVEGDVVSCHFVILPPWWRSGWAYTVYALLSIVLIVLAIYFIVQRVQLRNQIEIEHLRYTQSQEMMDFKLKFFTNISHEIRTPLTLIASPIETLSNEIDKESSNGQLVSSIKQNTQRLLVLVDQLLDFRKVEQKKMQPQRVYLDLCSFVEDILIAFRSSAENNSCALSVKCSLDRMIVSFDPDMMEKIVYNLLSNALKHTPSGGVILILLEKESNGFFIRVKNPGEEVSEEMRRNMFHRFESQGGTGIGLALVEELVKLHEGKILWDYDQELKMTCFSVFISQKESGVCSASNRASSDKTTRETLLVVEDNEELRNYIVQLLEREYCVVWAEDGKQALELLQTRIPDLIVTDLMMPNVDGIKLCRKVKEDINTSHIPVILLTAYTDVQNRLYGTQSGADLYLSKPFQNELLLANIHMLLSNRVRIKKHYLSYPTLEVQSLEESNTDKIFIEKLHSIIYKKIDDSSLGVEDLASAVGLSRSQLTRKLNTMMGMPPGQLILNYRMKYAAQLLVSTSLNVSEIAYSSGFSDPKYFSQNFKKILGKTPSAYRKDYKM